MCVCEVPVGANNSPLEEELLFLGSCDHDCCRDPPRFVGISTTRSDHPRLEITADTLNHADFTFSQVLVWVLFWSELPKAGPSKKAPNEI